MCKYIFHFRSRALLFNVFALENTNFHITLGVQNTFLWMNVKTTL